LQSRGKQAACHSGTDTACIVNRRIGALHSLRCNSDWVAADLPMIDKLAGLQHNGLYCGWRRIGRGIPALVILAFFLDTVVVGYLAHVGGDALPRHLGVINIGGANRQSTASNDLATIVKQTIDTQRHIAARQDLGRVTLFDLGFLHGTVVIKLGKSVVTVAGFPWGIQV